MSARVIALHWGKARAVSETGTDQWWDKAWQTGFFKERREGPQWLGYEGFRGDEQADRRYHGGVDKAVCVYPEEHYAFWRDQLALPDFPHGAFGENLTVRGLDESLACIGDIYTLGDAMVQVSQPRQPCWKLARRWRIKDLTARVESTGFTGYYFRVLRHGWVEQGGPLMLQDRSLPEWTIARCNDVMHREKDNREAARALAECSLLSASWKDSLWARSGGSIRSDEARLNGLR